MPFVTWVCSSSSRVALPWLCACKLLSIVSTFSTKALPISSAASRLRSLLMPRSPPLTPPPPPRWSPETVSCNGRERIAYHDKRHHMHSARQPWAPGLATVGRKPLHTCLAVFFFFEKKLRDFFTDCAKAFSTLLLLWRRSLFLWIGHVI